MDVTQKLKNFIFKSSSVSFLSILILISTVKSGIWFIPNLKSSQLIAVQPFINPLIEPDAHYLYWNWLSPFLAWLVHATTFKSYFAFHFVCSVLFSILFYVLCIRRLPHREARIAMILFSVLPVSMTAYYWVGMDSVTLLLALSAFIFPRQAAWALLIGFLLGMQHFEQLVFGSFTLCVAVFMGHYTNTEDMPSRRWCVFLLMGVLAGKLFLVSLFHHLGIQINSGRFYWLVKHLPNLLNIFYFNAQFILWSTLGLAWLFLVNSLERGKAALPVIVGIGLLLPFVAITGDQTRVFAVMSFPLMYALWLSNRAFLETVSDSFIAWVALAWFFIPYPWVWGVPRGSVFPYDVALVLHQFFGWFDVPEAAQISFWPFS